MKSKVINTIADMYPIDIKPFTEFAIGDYLFRNGVFYQKTANDKITSMRTGLEIKISDPEISFSTPLSFRHGGFTHG